jgi:hypothetical protein
VPHPTHDRSPTSTESIARTAHDPAMKDLAHDPSDFGDTTIGATDLAATHHEGTGEL